MVICELGAPETASPPGVQQAASPGAVQRAFDLTFRLAPETSGGQARVAAKQKVKWFSWRFRARAAQRRQRPDAVSP